MKSNHHALVRSSAIRGFIVAAALLVAFAANAKAQGPDLIIGDIPSVANYNPVGGIDAFALSLSTCNVGNASASWQGGTADHPVFQQRMFRYANGQFEMIGRSSVRHGFVAIAQALCGSCSGNGGSLLPSGCSDTMSAAGFGSQGGTGLSHEVDAFSGQVLFPPTDFSLTGNSIYKRLQVATSDLDSALHPGAQFFVDAQVIAADEAAAGNGNNNISWRGLTVSGGPNNYNATLTGAGPAVRERAGIYAWREADSAVRIVPVSIPGEGLVYVGYRGTPLPGGLWRYEVAVQNVNSDLAVGTFRLFFPSGATITDIGFHDLDYHSNEPFDGTDWTPGTTANSISWSTTPFATDPNANALRWGSLYNFRFTSDMPPSDNPISGEFELFKPTANPIVSFVIPPASVLTKISGEGARGNIGEDFDRDLVVELLTDSGNPVPNVTVTFEQSGGVPTVILPNGGLAVTDANGRASIRPMASASGSGPISIDAIVDDQVATFSDVFQRRFARTFTGPSGVLLFFVTMDWFNQPLTIAIDDSSFTPVQTIYGTLSTGILNPSPSFYALSGDIGSGLDYDPALMTGATGGLTRVYTGLSSLHMSGVSLNHQCYALRSNGGSLEVYISNTITATY